MILEITTNTVTGSEPTNLSTAKIYFRSEESDGIEDSIITSFLKQAREAIEIAINRSLVSRTLQVYLDDYVGYLPYGPIVPASFDIDSGTTDYSGKTYPYINESDACTINYNCTAYISEDLKNAIYELASFWYHRGDINDRSIPDKVKLVIKRHSRNLFV